MDGIAHTIIIVHTMDMVTDMVMDMVAIGVDITTDITMVIGMDIITECGDLLPITIMDTTTMEMESITENVIIPVEAMAEVIVPQ
jgi:hypothetical protein